MNIALWIVTTFLALGFGISGIMAVVMSKEAFRNVTKNWHWADSFEPGMLKAIGAFKVLLALGLVLPALTEIATWLVPLAALGLMLFMSGATAVRVVRREYAMAPGDVVFVALGGFVAWGRSFGPESFLTWL